MKLAGKTSPELDDLVFLEKQGFNSFELFITEEHVRNWEDYRENLDKTSMDVVSVHTPHVCSNDTKVLERSSEIAESFGALLVFHSANIYVENAVEIGESLDWDRIAYEHNPGFSRRGIESLILGKDVPLVLDTAHLYMGEEDFFSSLEELASRAVHIHLSDATRTEDGLGLGEGEIDVARMVRTVESSGFDRSSVVEVMPRVQKQSLDRVQKILKSTERISE